MARLHSSLLLLCIATAMAACSHRPPTVPTEPTRPREKGWTEKGDASWYGEPYHGRLTASGETYDMYEMTAAHRSLPFHTVVKVTRRDTGEHVTVRINDRGPFIKGRIIDLSLAAARAINLDVDGVAPVKLKVVKTATRPRKTPDRPAETAPCLWVQVGAFGDPANARRARKKLEDAGEKALVIEGLDHLERVRVGPFDSQRDANRALERLRSSWPAARLVECGG